MLRIGFGPPCIALLLRLASCVLCWNEATGHSNEISFADQGGAWKSEHRDRFYMQDEGSRLIPLAWLKVLKQADGQNFLTSAIRYGFIPNPSPANAAGLPVGFSLSDADQGSMVGMTCSACHTRQITVGNIAHRIDGAPALVDFAAFIIDLDAAVSRVLTSDADFREFADAVLGATATDEIAVLQLRAEVRLWSLRMHTLVARSLPSGDRWGPVRLDAISFIYNFIAGLEGAPDSTYVAPSNMQAADAPVRFPFLWNVGKQDHTQWTGIADFGDDDLALARDLSEIYGVFADYRPVRTPGALGPVDRDYILHNSACFECFTRLDELVGRIGPPVWPWRIDKDATERGKQVFDRPKERGGCVECHGQRPGEIRPSGVRPWKTPVVDVGTDTRAWSVLLRKGGTGALEGASIQGVVQPLGKVDLSLNLLKLSVAGVLIDRKAAAALAHPVATLVMEAFASSSKRGAPNPPKPNRYEARVLQGIWAAAPYLHNGSVPTLADLLKPPSQRPKSFQVGAAYDINKVGLSIDQATQAFTLRTTGCEDQNSGNSNCGHDFGTRLPEVERNELLEYLKSL